MKTTLDELNEEKEGLLAQLGSLGNMVRGSYVNAKLNVYH